LRRSETLSKALAPLDDRQRDASASATRNSDGLGSQFPELRNVQVDPYGIFDEKPAQRNDPQLG